MATRTWCLPVMLLWLMGCSSDSTQPSGGPDGGGGPNGATGGAQGSTGGANNATGGAASGAPGSGGSSGSHLDGSVSIGDAAHASPECVTFCTCMAKNCADKVFPGGCLPACAAGTSWDLPCRQNMCKLVPDQPNNDHCTHAFGTSECN